jgi:hypothetical protein
MDDEDRLGRKTDNVYAWPDGKSYQMTSLAYRSASEDGRKSDEKHIVSTSGANRNPSETSVDGVNCFSSWP